MEELTLMMVYLCLCVENFPLTAVSVQNFLRLHPTEKEVRKMKNPINRFFAMVGVLLTACAATAQMGRGSGPGAGMMGGPFHNTGTEVTITGTVDEVQQITGMGAAGQTWNCPRGWVGTHLMLKTDTGTLAVHLGPSAYLASKNFSIAKSDKLTILGSKVQYQASNFLIAKEITKGNQVLTVRNSAGFPLWTGFRMGSTPLPTTPSGK